MEGRKAELVERIESDREVLLDLFRRFIRCRSPNPPGDTREAAAHIRQFLARHGADCRVIAPNEIMPNIVATFEAGKLLGTGVSVILPSLMIGIDQGIVGERQQTFGEAVEGVLLYASEHFRGCLLAGILTGFEI